MILVLVTAIGLYYCYHHYQFWTHLNTENFDSLTEFKGESIKGYRGRQILIHEDFEPLLRRIDKYATDRNVELIVNQSYRPGVNLVGRTVVKPARYSNHLAGFAIDFNIKYAGEKYFSNELKKSKLKELPFSIQGFINDVRMDKDLRWGGDFRKEDPIHIDCPINLEKREIWKRNCSLCSEDYANRSPKWGI